VRLASSLVSSKMRDKNVLAHTRALPRMSWSPHNLFNLWKRSLGPKVSESKFERTSQTLFQQRWISKRLVRAYHGDHINEKSFKRWYLPATLPDVRPRKTAPGDDTASLIKWAKRDSDADQVVKRRKQEAKVALAPVGSLMFREVERRIDVFIFRSCFAHSVYEARRLVVHGNVKLNGKEHTNANTRLAPGDMVSVAPSAIRFLQRPSKPKSTTDEDVDVDVGVKEADARPNDMNTSLTPFTLPDYAAPFIFIPAYIEPSFTTCSAIYVRHPTARPGYSEIPTPYEADGEVVRLAWEWYAKRRPRMRSRSQLASMPENRENTQ